MTDAEGPDGGRARTEGSVARRLPTGTVTFLRTDVEGSMRLVRELGAAWDDVNAAHLGIIRSAVETHGGVVVRTEGDALFAAFAEARAAAQAAVAAQLAIQANHWPVNGTLAVRMGLHSGEAHLAGDDYGGFDVNRAARVAAAGHGGQILLSSTTTSLVEDQLPAGVHLVDLGSHQLRDVPRPERLAQLTIEGLPDQFPPVRTAGTVVGNLPDRLTSFVGREAEQQQVTDLLGRARLVTLTGPGGIGKSSLAVEVARQAAERFRDGAWFIPLADVADPRGISATIAHGIGIFDGPERSAASALLPYLADRSMLIVLDNFEHLVEGARSDRSDRPRISWLKVHRDESRATPSQRGTRSARPATARRSDSPVPCPRRGSPTRLGTGRGDRDRRRDLPAARRPATRDRAGRGTYRAPAAGGHPGSTRSTTPVARIRPARCPCSPANAGRRGGLEP